MQRARWKVKNHIVVNDAWRIAPWADALYACDAVWWNVSGPQFGEFVGERWSTHNPKPKNNDDKLAVAEQFGIRLLHGSHDPGFSLDLDVLHYGNNSGFQAVNLALHFGATKIWLLGFDMRVNSKRHFFGDHPAALANDTDYGAFIGDYETAARMLEPGIEIINATPDSALNCFPRAEL